MPKLNGNGINPYGKGYVSDLELMQEPKSFDDTNPTLKSNNSEIESSYNGLRPWLNFNPPLRVTPPMRIPETSTTDIKVPEPKEPNKEDKGNATGALRSLVFNTGSNKTTFLDYNKAIDAFDNSEFGRRMSRREMRDWAKDNNMNLTEAQLATMRRGYNSQNGGFFSRLWNGENANNAAVNVMTNYLNSGNVTRGLYFDIYGNAIKEGDASYNADNANNYFTSLDARNQAIKNWYANLNNWNYDSNTGKLTVNAFKLLNGLLVADGNNVWNMDLNTYNNLGLTGDFDQFSDAAKGKRYWEDAKQFSKPYKGSETTTWKNSENIYKLFFGDNYLELLKKDPNSFHTELKERIKNYMRSKQEFINPHVARLFKTWINGYLDPGYLLQVGNHPDVKYAKYNPNMSDQTQQYIYKTGGKVSYFENNGIIKAQSGALLNYGAADFIPGLDVYRLLQRLNAIKNDTTLSAEEKAELLKKARWEQAGNIVGTALMFTPAGWIGKGAKFIIGGNKLRKANKAVKAADKAVEAARATHKPTRAAQKVAKEARVAQLAATPKVATWLAEHPGMTKLGLYGASKGAGLMAGNTAPAVIYNPLGMNASDTLPVTAENNYTLDSINSNQEYTINPTKSTYTWYVKQGGILMNKIDYFQAGGTVAPQQTTTENNIEQQVIALVQAAMQGDLKATLTIDQIMQAAQSGDLLATQIAQMIQEVAKQMQGQAQAAKYGAKVAYLRKLKTGVNADEEVIYLKCGGKTVKKVVKKAACGGSTKVSKDACGQKLACGKKIQKKSC